MTAYRFCLGLLGAITLGVAVAKSAIWLDRSVRLTAYEMNQQAIQREADRVVSEHRAEVERKHAELCRETAADKGDLAVACAIVFAAVVVAVSLRRANT